MYFVDTATVATKDKEARCEPMSLLLYIGKGEWHRAKDRHFVILFSEGIFCWGLLFFVSVEEEGSDGGRDNSKK